MWVNFAPSASLPQPNMDESLVSAKLDAQILVIQNLEDVYTRHCQILIQYLFYLSLLT